MTRQEAYTEYRFGIYVTEELVEKTEDRECAHLCEYKKCIYIHRL